MTGADDHPSESEDPEGATEGGARGSLLARYGLAVLLGLAAAGIAWWAQQQPGSHTVTPARVDAPRDGD